MIANSTWAGKLKLCSHEPAVIKYHKLCSLQPVTIIKESQHFQSCPNPLSVFAVLQASSFILTEAQIQLSKSGRCLIKHFGSFKFMKYRKATVDFLQSGEKGVQEQEVLSSFMGWWKWVRKVPKFANELAELKGTLQVPQHLWVCSCYHLCVGQLEGFSI